MKKKLFHFVNINQYRNNFSNLDIIFSNHKDVETKLKILSISIQKSSISQKYIKNTSKDNFFYKDFINYLKTIRNSNNSLT